MLFKGTGYKKEVKTEMMKKNKEEEVNNNEDKKQRTRLEYPGSDCPLICPKMEEYYKEKIKNQTSETL